MIKRAGLYSGITISVVIFILVLAITLAGTGSVGDTVKSEGLVAVTRMVKRAVVECYALEGEYPPNIEYLEQFYGIDYNSEKYVVYYQSLGDNIMPQIKVMGRS